MKLNKQFEYELENPIEYHDGGDLASSKNLVLLAPSFSQIKRAAKLKQGFFQAIKSFQGDKKQDESKNKAANDESDFDADAVLTVLFMGDIDIAAYFEDFEKLLTSGVCKVNGKVELNSIMCSKLSVEDMEKLLAEYIVNFLLPASMRQKKAS